MKPFVGLCSINRKKDMIDWIKYRLEGWLLFIEMVFTMALYLVLIGVIMGIVFGVPAMVFVWVVESISNLFR